jgi:hypothetical protein
LEEQMAKSGLTQRSSLAEESACKAAPEVEVSDDPEWAPALDALQGWKKGPKYTGKSNPAPIAILLRSGKPVPEAVAKELGLWLDPPWGKRGPRIVAVLPKRHYPGTDGIKSLIATKRKVEEALKTKGKLEAAVQEVMTDTRRSRSYVMGAWALSDRKIVLLTSKFNPDPLLSPREPEES